MKYEKEAERIELEKARKELKKFIDPISLNSSSQPSVVTIEYETST